MAGASSVSMRSWTRWAARSDRRPVGTPPPRSRTTTGRSIVGCLRSATRPVSGADVCPARRRSVPRSCMRSATRWPSVSRTSCSDARISRRAGIPVRLRCRRPRRSRPASSAGTTRGAAERSRRSNGGLSSETGLDSRRPPRPPRRGRKCSQARAPERPDDCAGAQGGTVDALVTGATGFIGSRLAERLALGGHRVIAFGAERTAQEAERRRQLESRGISVHTGRLDDRPLLRRLAGSVDAVFHLAAAQHESNAGARYFRAVNVDGTRNLLDACEEAGVRRFVYGSTIGVYGSARNGRLDETSATRPENIYGVTKLEAEREVARRRERLGRPIVGISGTSGPGDGRLAKLLRRVGSSIAPT